MALPNAFLTFLVSTFCFDTQEFSNDDAKTAQLVIASASSVMLFILYNRSRVSYNRWWEGGTLLQKARGEWFNAFSSIMAFTSTKPELRPQVDHYVHLISRLMSLLMCCALQQVSPNRDRPFEIIGLEGLEPASMEFLNSAPDKVEIILQWIQRSMVLHTNTGVLPVAPPILSRAFQEVSRGIVNLQNARKIADFPYPFPLAQVSMILQLAHWAATPFASALALPMPWAVMLSFFSIFVLWCIHFNALDLEFPFGTRVNDLPMNEFQQEWNKSVCTLIHRTAQRPPTFNYDPVVHDDLIVQMSDASDLYIPTNPQGNHASRSKIQIKQGNTTGKRASVMISYREQQELAQRFNPDGDCNGAVPSAPDTPKEHRPPTPTETQTLLPKADDKLDGKVEVLVYPLVETTPLSENSAIHLSETSNLNDTTSSVWTPSCDGSTVERKDIDRERSDRSSMDKKAPDRVDRKAPDRPISDGCREPARETLQTSSPSPGMPSSVNSRQGMPSSTNNIQSSGHNSGILKQPMGIQPLVLDHHAPMKNASTFGASSYHTDRASI